MSQITIDIHPTAESTQFWYLVATCAYGTFEYVRSLHQAFQKTKVSNYVAMKVVHPPRKMYVSKTISCPYPFELSLVQGSYYLSGSTCPESRVRWGCKIVFQINWCMLPSKLIRVLFNYSANFNYSSVVLAFVSCWIDQYSLILPKVRSSNYSIHSAESMD